jgi:hypothetical protein
MTVAIGVAWAIAWLSQLPIGSGTSDSGMLRLGWRARPERIETCQSVDDQALASVPRHMRQPVICEGENASYRLEVAVDGQAAAERIVEAGGLRRDRPLYVFLEVPVPAGEVDVAVRFTRVEPADDDPDAGAADEDRDGPDDSRAAMARRDQLMEAVPPRLEYERRLRFAPRQVRVITYDPRRRELVEIVH